VADKLVIETGNSSPEATMQRSGRVAFGDCRLDLRTGELDRAGMRVYLQEQPLQVLRLLLEKSGELVTREELRQRLWPGDTFVNFDQGLNKAIQKLRIALDDSSAEPRFIETLPRRGYRFIGSVAHPEPASSGTSAPPARARWRKLSIIAMVAAAVTVACIAWVIRGSQRTSAPPQVQRLAVLPFQNLSGDTGQEYFSDGMTEELIARLSVYDPQSLHVVARTSVMPYKATQKTVEQIGRDLDVDYILEGSVRRDQSRVVVTAQLVRVRDQGHLWTQTYERESSAVVPVQMDIARKVAGSIGLRLVGYGGRAVRLLHPAAHEEYLRGLSLLHSGGSASAAASMKHFQRSIELQPDYAEAHASLAFSYNFLSSGEVLDPKDGFPHAKAAALRAIELDPELPQAHAALAFVLRNYEWDWSGAEEEIGKALRADPNNPVAHQVYGLLLSTVGRHQQAILEIERAAELDPLSPTVSSNRSMIYVNARQYDKALAIWQQRRALTPTNPPWWGSFLLVLGRNQEALAEFERSQHPRDLVGRAHALAALGRDAEARALLRQLERRPDARSILSPFFARAYAELGDFDAAFRWLNIAIDERAARVIFLKVDPAWDPLRADPRFQRLLTRMNLAE
jgi:TolB-like protein/DNA-binding winged helix-turn-helix (wHTH) protein/tetratricopeptide (TPR) repeat protein